MQLEIGKFMNRFAFKYSSIRASKRPDTPCLPYFPYFPYLPCSPYSPYIPYPPIQNRGKQS